MRLIIILIFALTGSQAASQNHLLGEDSPYLQQHLYNAVDWYPWGEEALAKARAEGKPIFLSIGYSSCHWCHVMEEESFDNPEIGAFLNAHFVSIKVDRERRPDLDEQFMMVTQTVSGAGGWPNSVFLTSEAQPFYGGTYFPPDVFLDLLGQIETLWRTERDSVIAEAANLSSTVQRYMTRGAAARDLTPALANAVVKRMLSSLDPFNGGMGTAPKFPQESAYLYMLDQADREANPAFLEGVTLTLDGMIKGGIHDQVGGGFHRYATDPEWRIPHFEKMLYNQAMIGRLLVRASYLTGAAPYRRAAVRALDAVLRDMQDGQGGFYAALDADSATRSGEMAEGAYYVWTQQQVRDAAGDQAGYLIDMLNITDEGNLDGASSLFLTDLPDDPARLDAALALLFQARQTRPAPFVDQKIVVGWNAMMIATLAEASHTLNRPDYYQAAARAARFMLDTMQDAQGLSRISLNGVTNTPAQLSDYAAFGLALVALHDYAPDGDGAKWLPDAEAMAAAATDWFAEPNGLLRMNQIPQGLGAIYALDDGEIPGGNALTLELLVRLSNRLPVPEYAQQATLLASALSGQALAAPEQRAGSLAALQMLNAGERGPVRYVANGAVRVEAAMGNGALEITLTVAPGWHVNAHQPLEDYFIATDLTVAGTPLPEQDYPEALVKTLAFNSDQPLALYEGTFTLRAPLPEYEEFAGPERAVLTLQACSDAICLAPQEVAFTLW